MYKETICPPDKMLTLKPLSPPDLRPPLAGRGLLERLLDGGSHPITENDTAQSHAQTMTHGPLIGECLETSHPHLQGRARVRWEMSPGDSLERWIPILQTLSLRRGDRVLLIQPTNYPEPLVIGVVDGFSRALRPPPIEGPVFTLPNNEALHITDQDGREIVRVFAGVQGPIVQIQGEDVTIDAPRRLCLRAESIELEATRGGLNISATDDVVVKGEMIHLN